MAPRAATLGLLWLLIAPASLEAANKKHLREEPMSDTFVIETSLGNITIQLDPQKAPLHAANFTKYVGDRFYDGLIFHRVIKDFMIQAGGHQQDMAQKTATGMGVKNKSLNGLKNLRGTLAAARTSDPDSAKAQFFINLKDNAFLDGAAATGKVGYSVFGRVTAGMDVVDKIAAVRTGQKAGLKDVPEETVQIKTVRHVK